MNVHCSSCNNEARFGQASKLCLLAKIQAPERLCSITLMGNLGQMLQGVYTAPKISHIKIIKTLLLVIYGF